MIDKVDMVGDPLAMNVIIIQGMIFVIIVHGMKRTGNVLFQKIKKKFKLN